MFIVAFIFIATTDAPDKTSQDKKDSDSADWEKELQDELQVVLCT